MPDDYAEAVSRVMATANWHTYQLLTKRSERLLQLLKGRLRFAAEQEKHLVGRQRRRSETWFAPSGSSSASPRESSIPLD